MLSDLRNQVQVLTKERNKLKELGLTAEARQNMEAQLAKAKLENSKLAKDLLEATEDMQRFKDRAEATEGEAISLKDQLREEQAKSQKLDEDKARLEMSLKA